jgi:hypothetical protein
MRPLTRPFSPFDIIGKLHDLDAAPGESAGPNQCGVGGASAAALDRFALIPGLIHFWETALFLRLPVTPRHTPGRDG